MVHRIDKKRRGHAVCFEEMLLAAGVVVVVAGFTICAAANGCEVSLLFVRQRNGRRVERHCRLLLLLVLVVLNVMKLMRMRRMGGLLIRVG